MNEKIILNENPKIKLKWWTQNLELCDMQALTEPPAEVLIQTDVSNKDWGQRAMESQQGDVVSSEKEKPNKFMELLSTKLAMQMFSKTLKHKATHLQVGNKVVLNLTYLLKMGGGSTQQDLTRIWNYSN